MLIKFWSTRGSIPAPGKETVEYGGNTSCVSLELKSKKLIILDAGTGIRKLGLELLKTKQPINAHIFITHSHWDHIQGIPFFMPIYGKQNEFTFISNSSTTKMLKQSMEDLLKHPYFPVSYASLPSKMNFELPENGKFQIDNAKIEVIPTKHPDMTSAYKFIEDGKTFVYMTDNEITYPDFEINLFDALVNFCKGADVLVHDAQYSKEEYLSKKGWGHTCYDAALELALKAEAKQLCFFHHDPEYSDQKISKIVNEIKSLPRVKKSKIKLSAAKEGEQIKL